MSTKPIRMPGNFLYRHSFYTRLVDRQRLRIVGYLFLLFVVAGLQMPVPLLFSALVDGISNHAERDSLRALIAGVAGLTSLSLLLATRANLFGIAITQRFQHDLRIAVFTALQSAPWKRVRRFDFGDLRSRMIGDIATLHHLSPTGLAHALRDVIFILALGAMLFHQSAAIAWSILGFLPLAIALFRILGRRLSERSRLARIGQAQANVTLHESLLSLRESRITASCDFHRARLRAGLLRSDDMMLGMHRHSALMQGVLGLIPVVITATIWLIGQAKVDAQEFTVGQLVSLFLLLSLLYSPVSTLFNAASGYVVELAAWQRIVALCEDSHRDSDEVPCELHHRSLPSDARIAPPALALHGVAFSYDSEPIFNQLDATIAAGRCTALVGGNGVGKSTLALMLLGLERPSQGSVRIDGEDLSVGMTALHGCVAYVPQQVFVFADSLRANIAMGRDMPDQHIRQLAQQLGWTEALFSAPDALDQIIAEGGNRLSGGQRQKIALLRALVGQPRLLILDEPDNNLDADSLQQLVTYLNSIKGKTTVVLITHGQAFASIIEDILEIPDPRL